jgi:hypothetical protein
MRPNPCIWFRGSSGDQQPKAEENHLSNTALGLKADNANMVKLFVQTCLLVLGMRILGVVRDVQGLRELRISGERRTYSVCRFLLYGVLVPLPPRRRFRGQENRTKFLPNQNLSENMHPFG